MFLKRDKKMPKEVEAIEFSNVQPVAQSVVSPVYEPDVAKPKNSSKLGDFFKPTWRKLTAFLILTLVVAGGIILVFRNQYTGTAHNSSASSVAPVIVLDPGHSPSTCKVVKDGLVTAGAPGEMGVNWAVANYLQPKLQALGYTVVMTKTSLNDCVSNQSRAEIANANNAALFFRIHQNAGSDSHYFMMTPNVTSPYTGLPTADSRAKGLAAAHIIIPALDAAKMPLTSSSSPYWIDSMGGNSGDDPKCPNLFDGSCYSKVPVTLIEMGGAAHVWLDAAVNQDKMATALANALSLAVPIDGVYPTPTASITPIPSVTPTSTKGTRYEQTNTNIVKTGTWSTFAKTAASGASYGRSNTANASATISFSGTRLDIVAMKGTTTGIMDVYLDGNLKSTLVTGATTASYQVALWSTDTVEQGTHTVKIVRNSASVSTEFLTLDAVDIWGTIIAAASPTPTPTPSPSTSVTTPTRYEQTNSNVVKAGTWATFTKSDASGGSYGRSASAGSSATVSFTGTRLDIISMKGTTTGIMDVYLDGNLMTTIDTASTTAVYKLVLWSTGEIAQGTHTVKIARNSASTTSEYLTLDAVDIWGTITK
jgi:N-acetylmuramoyl-L-alanine amidase